MGHTFFFIFFIIFIIPVDSRAQFQATSTRITSDNLQSLSTTHDSPTHDAFIDTVAAPASNSIYLEIAGSAIAGAINYERMLTNSFALRVGFGYAPLSGTNSKNETVHASITSAPLTLSWFPLSNSDSASSDKLEIGAGALYANLSRKLGPFAEFNGIGYTGIIGYRYQPWDGGFLFRITFTPIILAGNFQAYGGISFGYGF